MSHIVFLVFSHHKTNPTDSHHLSQILSFCRTPISRYNSYKYSVSTKIKFGEWYNISLTQPINHCVNLYMKMRLLNLDIYNCLYKCFLITLHTLAGNMVSHNNCICWACHNQLPWDIAKYIRNNFFHYNQFCLNPLIISRFP